MQFDGVSRCPAWWCNVYSVGLISVRRLDYCKAVLLLDDSGQIVHRNVPMSSHSTQYNLMLI